MAMIVHLKINGVERDAERPTHLLIYSAGNDTGGQNYRIKRAFDRYAPDFEAHAAHATPSYMDYPREIVSDTKTLCEMRRLFAHADVLHLNNTRAGLGRFAIAASQPAILHHHGSRFRSGHKAIAEGARKAGYPQIVSTLDLMTLEPDLTWCPSPFPVEELFSIGQENKREPDGIIRIVQCPTARAVKGTEVLIKAVFDLRQEGYPVELDLVEHETWKTTLRRKAAADIFVDQPGGFGYGNNAVEAWCMGLPVVSGINEDRVPGTRDLMLETWGRLPFVEASEETLTDVLRNLILDRQMRLAYGSYGLAHARRWHSEEYVANLLRGVYQEAIDEQCRRKAARTGKQ